ncbi:MAG: hypothetical protein OQK24_02075 [Magnetovibrio sp.]|nr:hypothetical protein [Magnetovibrio sp.]
MTIFRGTLIDGISKPLQIFLVSVFLFISDGKAGTPATSSLQTLIDQAKAALIAEDIETFDTYMARLFERVTGMSNSTDQVPTGMAEAEYIRRMCEYAKVSEPIYTPVLLNVIRHQTALTGYMAVVDGEEKQLHFRVAANCTHDDGRPEIISKYMMDGLSWAKEFLAADAAQSTRMAQDIKTLSEQNPKIEELAILAKLVGFDAVEKQRAEDPEIRKAEQKAKQITFRTRLVEKAHKGDLSAQLEVAHGLETGDKFRKDISMAYFWYKRAHENSGGGKAQAGMDRLLPHLTDVDWSKIDLWTRKGHRPY